MKIVIIENFHVYDRAGDRVSYSKGMVLEAADIPAGHTADDWVAKGLAMVA